MGKNKTKKIVKKSVDKKAKVSGNAKKKKK
jgi:hypothetical protein